MGERSTAETEAASSRQEHQEEKVIIFDTTLRDGEQSPGASMTFEEKIQVAELLDALGVDVIEAGFPIASDGDFKSVEAIAQRVQNACVCGLARAQKPDIERAGEAIRKARRPRIHTFIATSPLHMQYKLRMEPEIVLETLRASVRLARNFTDDVEWSAEDATRSEVDFLCRCVEAAIQEGARTINIPDTVGYTIPEEFYALIKILRERVPGTEGVVFSVHCHNDLGLAVANSLAGVRAGARQIECSINGLGERAGNAALEEVVMALRTRNDVLPFHTSVRTEMLMQASRLVSAVSGFQVQYNKAIVGRNAFAHESGIHQDGMLKHKGTYEIMQPADVGVKTSTLPMGKHSGRHAFREKLSSLGYVLEESVFADAFRRFKALADCKKMIYDEDIIALVENEVSLQNKGAKLLSLTVVAGTGGSQRAIVTLDQEGTHRTEYAGGDGPVDATFNAIRKIIPHTAVLELYQVHAVTEGTDAQAEVSVRLEQDGNVTTGRAADTDTLVASALAYINALNKLHLLTERKVRATL